MKQVLSTISLLFFIFSLFLGFSGVYAGENNEEEKYFIVTAYYSPLPDQKHYLTGNYEDEVILNGQGIAGASGKKVFSGMLAAPKKYNFGTKIYLDGLGIGEVADRGGAIVPAGERGYSYDRIDVWMGQGDDGLRRAIFWGKRKVYGYTVDSGNAVNLNYKGVPSPSDDSLGIKALPGAQEKRSDIFMISINEKSSKDNIQELQKILSELEYLKIEEISGNYDAATISAIYDFQINTKILSSERDIGAGVYGPRTRKELQNLYEAYQKQSAEKEAFNTLILPLQEEALENAETYIESLEKPLFGEISPRVRELQKLLSKLGFFESKDTAIFGVKTQNALLEYQLSREIIMKIQDVGAGTFGPQTRAQMSKDLAEIYFEEMLEKKSLLEQYKIYNPNESTDIKPNISQDIGLFEISSQV